MRKEFGKHTGNSSKSLIIFFSKYKFNKKFILRNLKSSSGVPCLNCFSQVCCKLSKFLMFSVVLLQFIKQCNLHIFHFLFDNSGCY